MSTYSRRYNDGPSSFVQETRGRPENKVVTKQTTKWSGTPSRQKRIGKEDVDTIITGHLTQEQVDAYQQYFRVEEISDILRTSSERQVEVLSLLPSGDLTNNPNYEREPSPPPKYDATGNRTNTREARTRLFLEKERHYLVEVAAGSIKNYMSPIDYRKPVKTYEKIYIPVKDYPDINFVGLLLGPRGNTLRQLQEQSGARLAIRGKGSVKDGKSTASNNDDEDASSALSFSNPNLNSSGNDDLHVVITSDSQSKIAKAIKLTNEVIEKAISSPVGQNDLKRGQLRELAVLNGTLRETKPYVRETQSRRPRQGLDVSQIVCKSCGKVGHFARDCKFNNPDMNDAGGNDPGQGGSYEPLHESSYSDSRRHRDEEEPRRSRREEILPPWKKKKPNAPLPPWQKAHQPPSSIAPPPPSSIAPPPPSSIAPPPPSSIAPPPPSSIAPPPPSTIAPPPPSSIAPPPPSSIAPPPPSTIAPPPPSTIAPPPPSTIAPPPPSTIAPPPPSSIAPPPPSSIAPPPPSSIAPPPPSTIAPPPPSSIAPPPPSSIAPPPPSSIAPPPPSSVAPPPPPPGLDQTAQKNSKTDKS